MAYTPVNPMLGIQPIAVSSTTANHPLGTIVHGYDPTYGEGEFIYLLGVASTVVGSAVAYDTSGYQTKLAPIGANKPEPIAFAMSANGAAAYGWYQISGRAIASKTSGLALASNAAVGVLTAGKIAATGTGKEVQGALTVAKATTATTVSLIINRPLMQGRVS
jgi:hypothetical protein